MKLTIKKNVDEIGTASIDILYTGIFCKSFSSDLQLPYLRIARKAYNEALFSSNFTSSLGET